VTGPAAPPLPAELDALVRRMRLPYLRKAAPDVLATARAQRWEPAEVLRVLLAEEVTGRDAATRRMRRKTAGFPSGKTFSSWRPEESSVPAATQDALATLEWIGRAENLVIAGPSGTGKSHLVEALAHAAIEKDLRVAWFTLETLTAAIGRAKADASVARTVTRICRADLIVVDLCRPCNYADARVTCRGGGPVQGGLGGGWPVPAVGIVTGFRGRRERRQVVCSGRVLLLPAWLARARVP
jgi:DNA replication protein DnaC